MRHQTVYLPVSLDSRGELNSITDEDLRRVDPSSPEVGDGGGVAATKWRCFSRTDSKISTNIQNNFNTHVITEKLFNQAISGSVIFCCLRKCGQIGKYYIFKVQYYMSSL